MFAGVLAFGSLAAACGDKVEITQAVPLNEVQSVTVSPPSASLTVGQTITLASNVTASGTVVRTVAWTTSSAAVATVDQTGKVTAIGAGTATIIATSTADASKAGAAVITVGATTPTNPPQLGINSVTQFGVPVNLSNTAGQIDVTLNISNTSGGAGSVEVFLSTNCTANTISASDVSVATQAVQAGQAGTVTLSFNTAQLTAANAPRFSNGNYCIKSRLTSGTASVVATNLTPITLNNTNVFRGTLSFASANGGTVTSAVSTLNGLQYNQGNLTVTVNPAIFTTSSQIALISGYLTRNGEQAGGASPGPAVFNNVSVSPSGTATIAFMDTLGTPAATSIYQYTSLPAGDTLYITAATDVAGNQVSVPNNRFIVLGGNGVRIDNDSPNPAGAYTVTAPNGYVGAAYAFSSGTSGAAASDTKGGVSGVGGVSTTYYVGPAGGTVFNGSAATLCSTTGLTAVVSGSDLPNTNTITPDQAKVIITDALGNKTCQIVPVTAVVGSAVTFGVDKVAPMIAIVPPNPANAPVGFSNNNGAADMTGYNVSKNFSFVYTDSISGFTNGVILTPLSGTLTKNFFTAGVSPIADCVIGTWVGGSTRTCKDTLITPTTSITTGANSAPFNVNSIEFTTPQQAGRGAVGTNGYFMFSGKVTDLAGNVSTVVNRLSAFDNVAPTIGALTQSPAAAVSLGSVTVTGTAADNLDLTSSSGSLSYPTVTPAPFASVAGTSFGPNFDAATVTSAPASVTLANVYRGMQNTSGANVIMAGGVAPSATITVTDVGTNVSAASPALTITTSTAKADILVGNTFVGTPSVGAAPATRQASTTINVNVTGLIADPAFQSQPFAVVEIYKLTGGALVFQSSTASPLVTDAAPNRTYSYAITGVALSNAAANTFYAIGRNIAGDAVISQAIVVTNP